MYKSVKVALPKAELTETLIGRVGFKEFSIDDLRDFIQIIKNQFSEVSSTSEVGVGAGILSSSPTLQKNGVNEE